MFTPVKLKKIICHKVKTYEQNTIHLIKQYLRGLIGFRYEAVETSISTTEGLLPINISEKRFFVHEKKGCRKKINDHHFLSLMKSLCLDVCMHDQERKTIQICHQHTVYRRQTSNHEGNL